MRGKVTTVLGEVPGDDLGCVLPHEHIASVYGVDEREVCILQGDGRRYTSPRSEQERAAWEQKVLDHYTPMLVRLRQQYDCRTMVEVSPWGFRQARDLEVWAELSRQTGVNIVASTGYYAPVVRPANFAERTITQLADHMIKEISVGIDGTDVRAGIIKIGVGDFGADDRKLLKAAAIAQRETGLSVTTHGANQSILDLLEGAGVPPERVYLGHADVHPSLIDLLQLVRRGCSVLFTIWGIRNPAWIGWRWPVLPRYHSAELTAGLVAEGYGDQVLASIDGWAGFVEGRIVEYLYEVEGRSALYMFTHVSDLLRTFGVSDEAIACIQRGNPRRMLVAA